MTDFLTRHMPTAQFIVDAVCTVIWLGGGIAIYSLLSSVTP